MMFSKADCSFTVLGSDQIRLQQGMASQGSREEQHPHSPKMSLSEMPHASSSQNICILTHELLFPPAVSDSVSLGLGLQSTRVGFIGIELSR